MKKIYLAVLFFVSPLYVSAQVVITEIMYDVSGTDTGREWIEVRNVGDQSIDLSLWKLFEAEANHKLTPVSGSSIEPGGYGIIVDNVEKFSTDFPSFSGLLFDSVFSLSNTEETLVLRNGDLVDSDSVTYSSGLGASGDGLSLQKDGNVWKTATPTPGSAFVGGTVSDTTTNTQSQSTTTQKTTETESKTTVVWHSHSSQTDATFGGDLVDFVVTGGRDRLAFVGIPLDFQAKIKQPQSLSMNSVSFSWSMGDGTQTSGSFISHTYAFPGDYNVVLNATYREQRAVARFQVKVVTPDVAIVHASDDFIEIVNKGGFETNVGRWVLLSGENKFIVPEDTIVASGSSIKIPTITTRLSSVATAGVQLLSPKNKEIASQASSGMVAGDFEMMIFDAPPKEVLEQRLREALVLYGTQASVVTPVRKVLPVKIIEKSSTGTISKKENSSPATSTIIFTVSKPEKPSLLKKIIGSFNY